MFPELKKSNRGEFEKSWSDVFERAEIKPPDHIWHKIDASLANSEATGYKRRILFFKLLAAASLVFAIGVGFYSVYINYTRTSGDETVASRESIDAIEDLSTSESVPSIPPAESIAKETPSDNFIFPTPDSEQLSNHLPEQQAPADAISDVKEDSFTRPGIDKLASRNRFPAYDEPRIRKDIRYMQDYLYLDAEEEKQEEPVFWAGVNFGTGLFDPNVNYGTSERGFLPFSIFGFSGAADEAIETTPSANDQYGGTATISTADNKSENYNVTGYEENDYQPDQAFAYGVNFGFRLSEKWMLQSGLSYSYNKAVTTTNSYYNVPLSESKIPSLYATDYVTEDLNQFNYLPESYSILNTFEFVSIPIDIGYRIYEGKLNILLKSGISTDIFLQNTIKDKDSEFEEIKLNYYEDSPFRKFYLKGKLSAQLNYTISRKYNISIEPGYRFALNSMTANYSGFTSYPSSFMISTGLWYSF